MSSIAMKASARLLLGTMALSTLVACQSVPNKTELKGSFLESKSTALTQQTETIGDENNSARKVGGQNLSPFIIQESNKAQDITSSYNLGTEANIKLSADELPLREFLHYVLGELLNVSYVLGEGVSADGASLTLNLKKPVSQKTLFELVEEMLAERGYVINLKDDIFFINLADSQTSAKNFVYGFGSDETDVPKTNLEIWQYAPFKYGFNGSLQIALSQFANVGVFPDPQNNLMQLRGKRDEIIKALELFNFIDSPTLSGRKVSIYRTVFSEPKSLSDSIKEILIQEGIKATGPESSNQALTIMPLEQIGAFLLFAKDQQIIDRALYWAEQLDQPKQGDELQYFIYSPRYSRAADLGGSLQALIGGGQSPGSSTTVRNENKSKSSNTPKNRVASNDQMGMVIDERANSLVFYTTGNEYRSLLPLIKRLDVLPKQIMLEMLIAEVSLTDEFAMGVEFALKNGSYTASTRGALGLDKIGGLSYILKGIDDRVDLNMFESNSLVEVLSRPSIVVRDGVAANIKVGSKIPTVGGTTSDPDGDRQTTEIVYQNTGVELTVTPTLSAQGVIIMEIEQNISNEVETSNPTVAGSPAIFERVIKTEAVADSGQTIILGGLISTRSSNGRSGVPGLKDLPILGGLFSADKENKEKTELVIMVTPKVIESGDEWHKIKNDLKLQLDSVTLPE